METDLKEVVLNIHKNFPDSPQMIDATLTCLAVMDTLLISGLSHCIGLNLVGPSASSKSAVLSFFVGLIITLRVDNFTSRAFVTHYAGISREELEKIDLLSKLPGKCMIISDLAPLFTSSMEDLIQNIGVLTRIFDGQGYQSASGVYGMRGYTGRLIFSWLGATTPLPYRVWEALNRLGSRFVFLNMGEQVSSKDGLVGMLREGDLGGKVDNCSAVIREFMEALWKLHGGTGNVKWDTKADDKNLLIEISKMAIDVVNWRGIIQREDETGHNPPLIESPQRLVSTLYYIAQGCALIYGRTQLALADLKIVRAIAYSSMPQDRRLIREALLVRGFLTSEEVEGTIGCSRPTAHKVMGELKALGLVILEGSPRQHVIRLA